MRIIDKNTDFYDYLQGVYRDDTLTFDRTNSFVLTKEILCDKLYSSRRDNFTFLLLQVCNTFWLFLVEIKERDTWGNVLDYSVDLVSTWKNYNRDRCLIRLYEIILPWRVLWQFSSSRFKLKFTKDRLLNEPQPAIDAIDHKEYEVNWNLTKHTVYRGSDFNHSEEKSIPILKASGLAGLIDPLDIYLSFEEYFSSEKTASERTESVGITDSEKIENHGFDTKTSFRGK